MNILLVSQCNKRALTQTRRVLDQFAERRGDRTWQTPITQAGLTTLKKLLRQTARKNTAVACHWIRGRDHTELLWIVGDASRFNEQGAVATNTTRRNILRSADENDWRSAEDIKLITQLAALLHDLGKACDAFQTKLDKRSNRDARNLYRHEWVSLRLFQSFVGQQSDEKWLDALVQHAHDETRWLNRLERDGLDSSLSKPFANGVLPPLAKLVAWLLLSHHFLPQPPEGYEVKADTLKGMLADLTAYWNKAQDSNCTAEIEPFWSFSNGLPVSSPRWQQRVRVIAQNLTKRLAQSSFCQLDNAYLVHLSRLNLMLADHFYSSLKDPKHPDWIKQDSNYLLNANTDRKTGEINQKLDTHLLGVAKVANSLVRSLPTLSDSLPSLGRHPALKKRTPNPLFQWQNRAYEKTESIRDRVEKQGFFGINLASTGCGKTLANARIMYALANPKKGARFSIALGLRTLTLQTGKALRERLGLDDTELAIRVGGSASRQLFEQSLREAEQTGSASSVELLDDGSHILYEGNFNEHGVLKRLKHNPELKKLIAAPVLTCTVDHLIPATEGTRGGRQIAPMLRLMTSDVVLDEIDDFQMDDLPALTRLVHWIGLLGGRVLLSSATLPPALVEGLFRAYSDGRRQFQNNRGEPGSGLNICCAWYDEFKTSIHDCSESSEFKKEHQQFVTKRLKALKQSEIRRRGALIAFDPPVASVTEIRQSFAQVVHEQVHNLHKLHHSIDPITSKRVSFGLVRMANIEPLVDVAKSLLALGGSSGVHIHLCVYHSRFPLLLRSAIEKQLDSALNRREPNAVFDLPDIRRRIDAQAAQEQIFVVLGSPVTEVGRDHDYDWALVEPSSMRSIIQIAGRVKRHRTEACEHANIHILSKNLNACEKRGSIAYQKPGFENSQQRLENHDLRTILPPELWQTIDAQSRMKEAEVLNSASNFVDLEHAVMRSMMLFEHQASKPAKKKRGSRNTMQVVNKLGAYSWYMEPESQLTCGLNKKQPFRKKSEAETEYVLLPNEDEDDFIFTAINKEFGKTIGSSKQNYLCQRQSIALDNKSGMSLWGQSNYMTALENLAQALDIDLNQCARIYSQISLLDKDQEKGWLFHPALGFVRKK